MMEKRINRLAAALLLLLSAAFSSKAQFRYYTTDRGLPSNTVRTLLQDSDGIVWAGTSYGLCWCNGNEFTPCVPPPGEEWGKSVFDICESKDTKTLWIGTFEGIYCKDHGSRSTTRLHIDSLDGPTDDCSVNRIVADDNRNIWVGTIGQGLFRYSIPNGKWTSYQGKGPGATIIDILITHDKQIWLVCLDDCIYKYNTATDDFSAYPLADRFTGRKMVSGTCVCQDAYGNLWICDSNCDLWKVDRSDMRAVSFPFQSGHEKITARTILEFDPGEMLIGTNLGLLSFDSTRREYSWVDRGGKNNGQLNDKFVYALMKDSAGGLWVGTYFGGINYRSANTNIVKSIYPAPGCGSIISVMAETDGGKVLVGSDDGGLSIYDPLSGAYSRVDVDRNNSNMNIHALLTEGNFVWVGTFENGLYRIDRCSGRIRHYDGKYMEDGMTDVYSIFRDDRGTLWIGTTSGIGVLDEAAGLFRRKISLESHSDIVRILQHGGTLYFATEKNGLVKYSYATGDFGTVPGDYPKHVSCVDIYEGRIYAGTANGVYVLDAAGSLVPCDPPLLRNFQVSGMAPDYCGLWITTDKGLFCYDAAGQLVRYTVEDGFISDRFNIASILKLSSGAILTGSARGINSFVPSLLKNGGKPGLLRVIIKGAGTMVDGGEMTPARLDGSKIEVTGSRVGLSVDFIALNYESQRTNVYRYRLQGYEDGWHEVVSEDLAGGVLYTDIKPGSYSFKVQAARSPGAEFGPVSTLGIRVSRTARAVVVIVLLSSLGLVVLVALFLLSYRYRKQKRVSTSQKEDYLREAVSKSLYKDLLQKIREYARDNSMDGLAALADTPVDYSDSATMLGAEAVLRHFCEAAGPDLRYTYTGNNSAMVRPSVMLPALCSMVENALDDRGGAVSLKADASTDAVTVTALSGEVPVETVEIPLAGEAPVEFSSDKFVSKIVNIVRDNISDPYLSIEAIAETLGVSRVTLFKKVKKATGLTPNSLIIMIRMEKAAELLCLPNAKVGDVWEKTGFLSGSHFGKLFKSRYGLSPREFANKYTDMESYFKQNR